MAYQFELTLDDVKLVGYMLQLAAILGGHILPAQHLELINDFHEEIAHVLSCIPDPRIILVLQD